MNLESVYPQESFEIRSIFNVLPLPIAEEVLLHFYGNFEMIYDIIEIVLPVNRIGVGCRYFDSSGKRVYSEPFREAKSKLLQDRRFKKKTYSQAFAKYFPKCAGCNKHKPRGFLIKCKCVSEYEPSTAKYVTCPRHVRAISSWVWRGSHDEYLYDEYPYDEYPYDEYPYYEYSYYECLECKHQWQVKQYLRFS